MILKDHCELIMSKGLFVGDKNVLKIECIDGCVAGYMKLGKFLVMWNEETEKRKLNKAKQFGQLAASL